MNMKKLIATALAVVMIFGLVSVGFAAAVEFPDIEDHEYASSIEKLATLEVIQGYPDGTFKPDDRVKRSEFAKMIVVMLGLEETAELFEGVATVFPDVPGTHWASGYITVAHSLGIINGYPDGTFKPEKEITYHEALKMILTAMGYIEEGFRTVKWPVTWVMQAAEVKIDTGVPYLGDLPITRAQVAKLLDNSLTKDHVVPAPLGGFEKKEDVTFLSKMKVTELEGMVVDSPELWTNTTGKIKVGNKSFEYEDYEGLLGHQVKVWYKDSAIIDLVDLSTEEEVDADDWDTLATTAKGFTNEVKAFVNYTPATKWVVSDGVYKQVEWNGIPGDLPLSAADEIVVVYDENDKPIAVKALVYTPGEIDLVYDYSKAVYVGGSRLDLKNAEVEYKGIVSKFDDLEAGQKIYYIYYKGSTTPKIAPHAIIEVAGETVTGVLNRVAYNADGKVISLVVEGKTYSAVSGGISVSSDFIGKEVNLYLDRDGKVFNVELVKPPISDWFVGLITGKSQDKDGKYVTIFTQEDYEITVPYVVYEGSEPAVGQAVYAKIYEDHKIHFAPWASNTSAPSSYYSVAVAVYVYEPVTDEKVSTGIVTAHDTTNKEIEVRYSKTVGGHVYSKTETFSFIDETLWLQSLPGGVYEVRPVQA
ncbi:MAG TPA: S-layer homology domain-containing protein, partial [Firmicutes bacterium]|nr:S-layer homology domain-containing protein [Candidatus Fermentithermobacillaceae bacterium]